MNLLRDHCGYDLQIVLRLLRTHLLNDTDAMLNEVIVQSSNERLAELVAVALGAASRVTRLPWLPRIRLKLLRNCSFSYGAHRVRSRQRRRFNSLSHKRHLVEPSDLTLMFSGKRSWPFLQCVCVAPGYTRNELAGRSLRSSWLAR
jgi:hypothetical protein